MVSINELCDQMQDYLEKKNVAKINSILNKLND